jgi:hypothetical protein
MIPLTRERTSYDNNNALDDYCRSNYVLHEGLRIIPVMGGPDELPVIVRVHAPYTERKVDFQYAHTHRPPLIPTPADTLTGDVYLGGNIQSVAPTADSQGYLVFGVQGGYRYLCRRELRQEGRFRFDAHGYFSAVDILGWYNVNPNPKFPQDVGDCWQSPYFDLNQLVSARILG